MSRDLPEDPVLLAQAVLQVLREAGDRPVMLGPRVSRVIQDLLEHLVRLAQPAPPAILDPQALREASDPRATPGSGSPALPEKPDLKGRPGPLEPGPRETPGTRE